MVGRGDEPVSSALGAADSGGITERPGGNSESKKGQRENTARKRLHCGSRNFLQRRGQTGSLGARSCLRRVDGGTLPALPAGSGGGNLLCTRAQRRCACG